MLRVFIIFVSIFMFAYSEENLVLIPDFSYTYRNMSDEKYENLEIPGFFHGENHWKENGFNLNYVEIKLEHLLPYSIEFRSVFHITEESVKIDELYIRKSIDFIQIKAGKFRSSIGIINSLHQHQWFFTDPPAVYELLFSEHGLTEKGVGLEGRWRVFKVGFEVLNGENENSFGYRSIPEYSIDEVKNPSLHTFYIKTQLKDKDKVYRLGMSYLSGKRRAVGEEITAGNTKIYGLEGVVKISKITVQGEYFYRVIDGYMYYPVKEDLSKNQSGYYIQTVYYLTERVGLGFRYDKIDKNKINGQYLTKSSEKYSFGLNYHPVEQIKLRLNYIYNSLYRLENSKKNFNEFTVEMSIFLGKHHH